DDNKPGDDDNKPGDDDKPRDDDDKLGDNNDKPGDDDKNTEKSNADEENSDKKNVEKNSEKENIVKEKIKQLEEYIKEIEKKNIKKTYFFPPSTYTSMISYDSVFMQADSKKKVFYDELIEKHINNKFFLFLYGKKLIEVIINKDQDMLLRKFCNGCINHIEKNDDVPDMQLFNIVSHSIIEIFKKDPAFFAEFIIKISLLCILNSKNQFFLEHLHHYSSYNNLSELTYLDFLTNTIYNTFLYKNIIEIFSYIKKKSYSLFKKFISQFKLLKEKIIEKITGKTILKKKTSKKKFSKKIIPQQLTLIFPLPNFVMYDKDYNNWIELFKPKP
ncbi:779_t:CDS:1, partial [Dentiscutata heterogama]